LSKHFRPWKIDEIQLLPPSVQDYVPEDHLSRLIVTLVREELDLSAISGSYRSGLGQPPFEPQMTTALLLHGYASGLYSSRRIAKAALARADFMMIVAGDPPDFRTISDFRKRHLRALASLFASSHARVPGLRGGQAPRCDQARLRASDAASTRSAAIFQGSPRRA
jgi:transposase